MEDELDSNILDDELIDEDNNIAGTFKMMLRIIF